MPIRYLASSLAILAISAMPGSIVCQPAPSANAGIELTKIDELASHAFSEHPYGSLTIGVVAGDKLIWSKSYGYSDMENHELANADTVYRLGSVTKMFTALMLEQLADAGKVHLSDPVERYFPPVNLVQDRFRNAPPVTLVQLAGHTSGFSREPDDEAIYEKGSVADWEKVLIAALPHVHYIFEPGTQYSYSNIGYATLGAALAHASGEPYPDYVSRYILKPLGMAHSGLELNATLKQLLSKGYRANSRSVLDSDTPLRENEEGRGYKVPNGAMYSTVGDLARFASFLMGDGHESVLSAASLRAYWEKTIVSTDSQFKYGYGRGFEVSNRNGYIAVGHSGAVAGYQAAIYVNREKHLGVIALANSTGSRALATDDVALNGLDLLSR